MAAGHTAGGRRLEDTKFGDLPEGCTEEGTYWKYLSADGTPMESDDPQNLTGTVWGICCPEVGGIATLIHHTVREEEDGTISVRSGDGSSNSILVKKGSTEEQWHGYIDHGVWRKV